MTPVAVEVALLVCLAIVVIATILIDKYWFKKDWRAAP